MSSNAVSLARRSQETKIACDKMMGNTTTWSKIVNHASNIVLLAVTIIGILGAIGVFPGGTFMGGSILGWTTIGLGVGYLGVKLLGCNTRKRAMDLITSTALAAVIVTFGALGVTGILINTHVSYALMGTVVATVIVSSYVMICARNRAKNANLSERLK